MNKLLISIKTKYADKIFNGTKIYEFRRKSIGEKNINKKIYVYSSEKDRSIIGYITFDKVLKGDLEYDLICEFIKLRGDLGLTQQQMADASGVVREMIAVIENRKKHPQINTLIKILEPFIFYFNNRQSISKML